MLLYASITIRDASVAEYPHVRQIVCLLVSYMPLALNFAIFQGLVERSKQQSTLCECDCGTPPSHPKKQRCFSAPRAAACDYCYGHCMHRTAHSVTT